MDACHIDTSGATPEQEVNEFLHVLGQKKYFMNKLINISYVIVLPLTCNNTLFSK